MKRRAAMVALAVAITLLAMGCFIAVFSVWLPKAQAAELEWRQWGAAPYAASLEEACRKAGEAIDGFNWPATVKDHFRAELGITCKGGRETWLPPGLRLEQMWSGPSARYRGSHVLNDRTVAELPVLKSPDGRPYRKGSVAETARALTWLFAYEGKVYVLYLPHVCYNWAWTLASDAVVEKLAPKKEQCATVSYTVEPGDEVRFAVLARRRLSSSSCWELADGEMKSALPSPCDGCDWAGPKTAIPADFEPLHSGRYVAMTTRQTLRFPAEVTQEYVALCVTRFRVGISNAAVVMPRAWGKEFEVVIPPDKFPTWGIARVGEVILPAR